MPDLGAFVPALAIALLAVVLIWFAFGTQLNIRRGNRVLAWLQEGLPALGPRATLRWLGSSVAALSIVEPAPPYRRADVLVVLEPRDLGLLWALARRRGRRDVIILRLDLLRAPRFGAHLVDPDGWSPGGASSNDPLTEVGERTASNGRVYRVRDDGRAPLAELAEQWDALERASGGVWRLTVSQTVPHLEVHALPPDPRESGSARLFSAVRELADLVSAQSAQPRGR
jgi:hypothetical protein